MTLTYQRITRPIKCICNACMGRGFVATKDGYARCTAPGCVNGDAERWIVEIVAIEEGDE